MVDLPARQDQLDRPIGPPDLWTVTVGPDQATLSFGTMAGPGGLENNALWTAKLAPDVGDAVQRLEQAELELDLAEEALDGAESRLLALAASLERGPDVSFDASAVDGELPGPERDLTQLLYAAGREDMISYGLWDAVAPRLNQAREQFGAMATWIDQHVTNYAWVDTYQGSRFLARTTVTWSGNMGTVWETGLDSAQLDLHRQVVHLALAERARLLRTMVVVARQGIKLARLPALMATPGGAVLAMVLAWRFVNQVRAEVGPRAI